jgi:23S rRNA (cytosine1962-C5)-methyltransferase
LKKIILKPGKEQSLKRFHPWVFSGAMETMEELPGEGECVWVYSSKKECLGTGHYHSGSIAVRIFSFSCTEPTSGFWQSKLEKCLQLRVREGLYDNRNTNVFRLVNAEGDGLPGLIADYYNGTVVLQAHSAGMYRIIDQLAGVINNILGERLKAVYDKSPLSLKKLVPSEREGGYLRGHEHESKVRENGNSFRVDWVTGQKTGFFIDQRENRKLLGYYSGGRKILNMHCYSGGFSIYALRGGATLVHSVDSSASAIDLARENSLLNFPGDNREKLFCSEAFDFFRETSEKYDIVILDPPAFAKSRKSQNNALQAYKRLNYKAMELILPGGLLFTFSCSQVVAREQFRQAVYSAAIQSGREVRILHQLSQPADHPFSIYHAEGEYLKGLVLQII